MLLNKKTIVISLIILLILNISIPVYGSSSIRVDARSAIAIDSKSKVVLFEQNGRELVPIASTTKIVTALVAIKYGALDKKVTISERAATIKGSTVGFKKGEEITIKELLYGLMLRSGNDAAIAIAEGISGTVEEFVNLMNEYAKEIGLVNTHFETPHGLDKEYHYSTAYDLAMVTATAKENALFNEIVSSKDVEENVSGFTRSYKNINKILWKLKESDGVKTGYTGKAGKCLVTSVNYEDNDIIIVVLNCTGRWKETEKIYSYITKNFTFKKIFSKGERVCEINTNKGSLPLHCKDDIILPVKNNTELSIRIKKPENINRNIKKGDELGIIEVLTDNKKIYSNSLASGKDYKVNLIKRLFY